MSCYCVGRRFIRRHRMLYALVRVVKYGPFMGVRDQRARRRLLSRAWLQGWKLLYLGSGGRYQAGMVNLDLTPITGPDVVGNGYCLPFPDGTFDAVFCDYVIEHVGDPESFLAAASRVLKPEGIFYLEIPFLQPQHGGASDFTRWSRRGFIEVATRAGLAVEESGVHLGPAFTLFWILKEWIALAISFGIRPLSLSLNYLLSWVLSPLLLLDLAMLRMPGSEQLAAGFYVLASPLHSLDVEKAAADNTATASDAQLQGCGKPDSASALELDTALPHS